MVVMSPEMGLWTYHQEIHNEWYFTLVSLLNAKCRLTDNNGNRLKKTVHITHITLYTLQ